MKSLQIIFMLTLILGVNTSTAEDNTNYTVGVEDLDYYPFYTIKEGNYGGCGGAILAAFAKARGYTFKYEALPVQRLYQYLFDSKIDFKFPDNPYWREELKKQATPITYSDPVLDYIDGMMVLPENKGKGIDSLKFLGTVVGFTPWNYLDLIKQGKITLRENASLTGLLQQVLKGRISGVYVNPVVANHLLVEILHQPNSLVFDPDLPHVKSAYMLSSTKHPDIIKEFNNFLVEAKEQLAEFKKKCEIEQ